MGGWYVAGSKQLPRQGFAPELPRVVPPQPMKRLARADKGREAVKKPFLPSDVMAEVHICGHRTNRSSADQGTTQSSADQRSIQSSADQGSTWSSADQRTTQSSADQVCRWGQRQFRRWQRSIRIGAD